MVLGLGLGQTLSFAQGSVSPGADSYWIEANWNQQAASPLGPWEDCNQALRGSGALPGWLSYDAAPAVADARARFDPPAFALNASVFHDYAANLWFVIPVESSAEPDGEEMLLIQTFLALRCGGAINLWGLYGTGTTYGDLYRPQVILPAQGESRGYRTGLIGVSPPIGSYANGTIVPTKRVRYARPNGLLNWEQGKGVFHGAVPIFADEFCFRTELSHEGSQGMNGSGFVIKQWYPDDNPAFGRFSGQTLIRGTVELESWQGSQVQSHGFWVVVRDSKTCEIVEATHVIQFEEEVGSGHMFSYVTDLPPGTYEVSIRGRMWLRDVQSLTVTSTGATISATLRNGDITGDGIVDIVDYSYYSFAYGMTCEDSCWHTPSIGGVMPRDCDLNGDCEVDIGDYAILNDNWEEEDEPDCLN